MGLLMGIISELVSLVRQYGGQDEDIHRLATPDGRSVLEQIAKLIVEAGRKTCNVVRFVLPSALTLPSWSRGVVDGEDREAIYSGQNVELELVEFCDGQDYINGEEMLKRSLAKTRLAGNRAFEYLAAHLEIIPEEWQKFVLVFPGTILLDESGNRYVRYLDFSGGQWYRFSSWLGHNFSSSCRVVGFRK